MGRVLETCGRDALTDIAPKIKTKEIHSRSYHSVSRDDHPKPPDVHPVVPKSIQQPHSASPGFA